MKKLYNLSKNILLVVILTIAACYIFLYVAISIPSIQQVIKKRVEKELSSFLNGNIDISELTIHPFNQVIMNGISISDRNKDKIADIERLGAGINLWALLIDNQIEITYVEIISLNGQIKQSEENGPLNIQFIIDAFKPKNKNTPPTIFDLSIHNIVIRKSNLSFDKEWKPVFKESYRFDTNHISLKNICADISLPKLANDNFEIDLRRLSFEERSGFSLQSLKGFFTISNDKLSARNIILKLPNSKIQPQDITINIHGLKNLQKDINHITIPIVLEHNKITPSDLKIFSPLLSTFDKPFFITTNVVASINKVQIKNFAVDYSDDLFKLKTSADIIGLKSPNKIKCQVHSIKVESSAQFIGKLINSFGKIPLKTKEIISRCGSINFSGTSNFNLNKLLKTADIECNGNLFTSSGTLEFDVQYKKNLTSQSLLGNMIAKDIQLGKIINNENIGLLSLSSNFDVSAVKNDISGNANITLQKIGFNGYEYKDITAQLVKKANNLSLDLISRDPNSSFAISGSTILNGSNTTTDLMAKIDNINLSALKLYNKLTCNQFNGIVNTHLIGNSIDNLKGYIDINDIKLKDNNNEGISINKISLETDLVSFPNFVRLNSDYIDGELSGYFKLSKMPISIKKLLSEIMPDIIKYPTGLFDDIREKSKPTSQQFNFAFKIKKGIEIFDFFKIPISPIGDSEITGRYNESDKEAYFTLDAPYLRQGSKKIIKNTLLSAQLDGNRKKIDINLSATMTQKNGNIDLKFNSSLNNKQIDTDIAWKYDRTRAYRGVVSLSTIFSKDEVNDKLNILANIKPSVFQINDTLWHIGRSNIEYYDNKINVENVRVWRDNQFVTINGVVSQLPGDTLKVNLKNMNLDYIFETLNINHVTFGGQATGEFVATNIFTSNPIAYTPGLKVEALTYNDGLLGNAILKSRWNNEEKKVEINADIHDGKDSHSILDGGIWVTRDSLSFECDATRLNILFLKPFMAAFSNDISGRVSGKAHLYGTFHDIDLTAAILAHNLKMRVDYTNTYYSGTDSIIITPGNINISNFTLYDKNGNTAKLNGIVRHKFFRDPSFEFRITDAHNFLSYDTNSNINPIWYGTIYGDGGCSIIGVPGQVDIAVDMTTAPNSNFTFVLSDNEAASDYKFLSFSDRKKERKKQEQRQPSDSIAEIMKQNNTDGENLRPSIFKMDLRVTATPDAQMTLVMDPVAGDKIKAFGSGALQIGYSSETDAMTMFGEYTLERGSYNFTLQDIIIKDFIIKQGSNISFNGDPLNANLDISAIYRVNTNLSDLDKSFSTDKDLNRTNVPVDAVLNVNGNIKNPDITFDIELPTLTQDVVRKVKSIISTEDMMSRQIIYLLALNRFYTPEYMGKSTNNNELASVASSTISSHISNMLGQLSDNWSFSPYFRTDKGDFSDVEVDLALSSRLLNNRLLLNGNFGYRDRSTSSTTFVGDFDIEYLLNRQGSLRLKAYNHYNDQNYYLKSALTTQGIGIVFKYDFENWFNFLKRKNDSVIKTDSIKINKNKIATTHDLQK